MKALIIQTNSFYKHGEEYEVVFRHGKFWAIEYGRTSNKLLHIHEEDFILL